MAKAWGEGKEDLEEVGEDVTCYVVIDCSLINPGEGPCPSLKRTSKVTSRKQSRGNSAGVLKMRMKGAQESQLFNDEETGIV